MNTFKAPSAFYFLRHGKTQANLDGLMCGGAWDLPLCHEGIQQVAALAALSPRWAPLPASVFSSPLLRARATAEMVARQLNLSLTIIEGLREWDMGEWDRLPFEKVREAFLGGADPKNGETRAEFYKRIRAALAKCVSENEPPLIVSHGGVGLAIQEALGIPRVRMENCQLHYFTRSANGIWEAIKK